MLKAIKNMTRISLCTWLYKSLYKVEYYTYIVLYVENLFWKLKQETCFTFSEGLDKFGFGAFSQLTSADKTLINMPDWTKKMETQVGRD